MINADLIANFQSLSRRNQLAHAYLFNTVDGATALNSVLNLVQSLLCTGINDSNNLSACGQCKSCQLYLAGSHPDLRVFDNPDDSIGVDEIRSLSTWLQHKAQLQKGQFAILNYANNMTESAANALLKTLEEPSENSYLLLINDSGRGLIPTILSRCQVVNIQAKPKQLLAAEYGDLPSYLLGYANGNETKIQSWMKEGSAEQYQQVYLQFTGWLKANSTKAELLKSVQKVSDGTSFFVYLLERRVRQMLTKGFYDKSTKAMKEIKNFNFAHSQIKGQNKDLALAALIEKLDVLVK